MRLLVALCTFPVSVETVTWQKLISTSSFRGCLLGAGSLTRSPQPYCSSCEHSSGTSSHSLILQFLPPFPCCFVLQAKVAEELASATAQVSQLQLELTAHQKKEMDLRKQLSAALQEAERHETQLNKMQAQLAGET